ncbi:hypothetical protein ACSVDA_16795 [Cytobacillus sp. Hm23]
MLPTKSFVATIMVILLILSLITVEIKDNQDYIENKLTAEKENMNGFKAKKDISNLLTAEGFTNENGVFISLEELNKIKNIGFSNSYILNHVTDGFLKNQRILDSANKKL